MLTLKQERFVQELIKGKSQREAYRIAYPKSNNWKDDTVDQVACRLFKNVKVHARYDELMAEAIRPGVEDAESVRRMILETEMAIATANMGDLFEVVEDADGTLLQKAKSPESIKKFDMRAVKSYRFDSRGRIILELYDKQPAINSLKEMYNLVSDDEKEAIEIVLHKSEGYAE